MFLHEDDRTYSFEYHINEEDFKKELIFSKSGVIPLHEVQQFDKKGILRPLDYNKETKRHIKMVFAEKNTDWLKPDPEAWDTYNNIQEAVLCTLDNWIDYNMKNNNLKKEFLEWDGFSVFC